MTVSRKLLALAGGATLALSAAAIRPTQAQQPAEPRSAAEIIQDADATVEFIQKSQVAPLMEGNLESIELEIGKTVEKDGVLGFLYRKKADLTVKKAEVAARSTGAIEKAEAQKEQAIAVVSRNRRMLARGRDLVPQEDVEKAEAELRASIAMIKEAVESQELAKAEYDLAKNQVDEHTIKAPFGGVIIKWLKKPGESVSAREPVVEMGNLDKLRVFAYLPLETGSRVKEGDVVDFQPRLSELRGGTHPIGQKKFRGVITFIDPSIQPINETAIRVYAEIKNPEHELHPGYKGMLTIYLNSGGATPAPAAANPRPAAAEPVVPTSTVATPTGAELPPLPR